MLKLLRYIFIEFQLMIWKKVTCRSLIHVLNFSKKLLYFIYMMYICIHRKSGHGIINKLSVCPQHDLPEKRCLLIFFFFFQKQIYMYFFLPLNISKFHSDKISYPKFQHILKEKKISLPTYPCPTNTHPVLGRPNNNYFLIYTITN